MPLYEYACQTCYCAFERLKPMSQMNEPAACPDCGSDSKRQLSVFTSFSTGAGGEVKAVAGGGGGCSGGNCGGCSGHACSTGM